MTFQTAIDHKRGDTQGSHLATERVLAPSRALPLQPKLRISDSNDTLENEADAVAEQVMRTPDAHTATSGTPAALHSWAHDDKWAGNAHESLHSSGEALGAQTRADLESRFGYSFANVRIHSDRHAADFARSLGALAFTSGQHIAFAEDEYEPHTPAGAKLLAHELAHTVQQRGHANIVQCRRVPEGTALSSVLPVASTTDQAAHERGLLRVLRRAWDSLDPADKATAKTAAAGFGITGADDAALFASLAAGSRPKLLQFADAIRTVKPSFKLGDPALIDTGARPGTSDAANITTLVNGADAVFSTIAGGARDADIKAVFGAANIAAAKAKYAAARTRMAALKTADKIVTDRSGYSAEVSLGGLSNSAQISVSPGTIDNPTQKESIVTLIHESMHAGNSDVKDRGYIHQPSFKVLAESFKLTNAAHFEVVPRRMLGAGFSFSGETFVPAGTAGTAALTPKEEAIRSASETFRSSWAAGLNLHKLFVRVFKTPAEWSTIDLAGELAGAESGAHFKDTLPFWSKVENLTIHRRTGISPASAILGYRPVSIIDIALSEGLTRKLATGMRNVPQTEADAVTLEAGADPAQHTKIGLGPSSEAQVLLELVRDKATNEITGPRDRDVRAIERLAAASNATNFTDYLKKRTPADFAD